MASAPHHRRNRFFLLTHSLCLQFIVFVLFSLSFTPICRAASVTLAWNASSGIVVGYKLYQGTASKQYSSVTTVGNQTEYEVSDLESGTRYYFAVTAYNSYGESGYSNELSYTALTDDPDNTAPVAKSRAITTTANTRVYSKMIASDAEDDPLEFSIVTQPVKGTVVIRDSSEGTFHYTPYPGKTGTDSFRFRVSDGELYSNTAVVNVTVYSSAQSSAASASLRVSQDSDSAQSEDVVITLEAEAGQLGSSMEVLDDAQAAEGKCVRMYPVSRSQSKARADEGAATYVFDVPESGTYLIWGRVQSKDVHRNGLYVSMDAGSFVDWETALGGEGRWVWSALKEGQRSDPLQFELEEGQHVLTIKPMEEGVRIDQILITNRSSYFESTVYEDGEDLTALGWLTAGGGAESVAVMNVFDELCESHVIELTGAGLRNGYMLMTDDARAWDNESQHIVEWSLCSGKKFVVTVGVETTEGERSILYAPMGRDRLGTNGKVHLSLGKDLTDGQWHTFVRDLQVDLQRFQPSASITRVKSFAFWGSGRVDNVSLR